MSLAQLKDQAAHLQLAEQRELLAFLVSLQTERDQDFQRTPAQKTDDLGPAHRAESKGQPVDLSRPSGLCVGEFVTPADFDDPLPADILRVFEGA